jgi:hypothetical protein
MSANPFTDADPAASTPIMGARAPQEKSKGLYVQQLAKLLSLSTLKSHERVGFISRLA